MSSPSGPERISPIQATLNQMINAMRLESLLLRSLSQEMSETAFSERVDNVLFNPLAVQRRFETLEKRSEKAVKESALAEEAGEESLLIEDIESIAKSFEDRNPELKKELLAQLRAQIGKAPGSGSILESALRLFPDPYNADEAMEFLAKTMGKENAEALALAKKDLNAFYGRQVQAGKNISDVARANAFATLGSAASLRDLYYAITGRNWESRALFLELAGKYPFEKLESLLAFLLGSLGKDLNSEGPSIEFAKLSKMINDCRNMQDILAVFRHFRDTMPSLAGGFASNGLMVPAQLNFRTLSMELIKFLDEKYPSSSKALQIAKQLGLSEELIAQSLLFNRLRASLPEIPPRLFQGEEHKKMVDGTLLELLDTIEEQLEEEEEGFEDEEESDEEENDEET